MKIVGLLVASAFAFASPNANAMCAEPDVTFAPAAGDLPANPTIFVFVPKWLAGGTFTSDVAFVATPLDENDAFQPWKVELRATSGLATVRYVAPIEGEGPILPSETSRIERTYRLGSVEPGHASRVTDVSHHASRWTCSFTNAITISTEGDAIALRLDWVDGTHTIVPAADARLGHLSCTGATAYVPEVKDFDLVALFADGSARATGHSRLRIDDEIVRLPAELVTSSPIDFVSRRVVYPEEKWRSARFNSDEQDDTRVEIGALACLLALLFATRAVRLPRPS